MDVLGFCFLDLSTDYKPPEALVKWMDAGKKPIYVGFGSLVISLLISLTIVPDFKLNVSQSECSRKGGRFVNCSLSVFVSGK